jgi:hypothetical protein
MDDQEFLDRIKVKIERLTGVEIQLHIDQSDGNQIKLELERPTPEVTLGYNVLQYSGFARMAVEYAVASIREKRVLGDLEFHILLARN